MSCKDKNLNRREFLSRTVSGFTSLGLVGISGKAWSSIKPGEITPDKNNRIIYRTLGRTGIKLPIVSMGVMNSDNPILVQKALDEGIKHLDTAYGYMEGNNELMLGKVLKGRPRESFIIATKIPPEWDMSEGWNKRKVSSRSIKEPFLEKLNTSLKRLQMDYVDILYLHGLNNRETALNEQLLEVLTEAKEQGKVRFIGFSFHENFLELIQAAMESKVYEVILTVYSIRMAEWVEMNQLISEAAKAGLGIIAMKTQAGGYWDKERKHPMNMKGALKWVLQNENICTAIPGFTTFEQLKMDISVMSDLALTPEEIKDLQMGKEFGMSGLYCPQCGECIRQCPKHVDIPTIMRSYMYAYGYKNRPLAKKTLQLVHLENSPCVDCRACSVICPMGFDIRDRISDIMRLKKVPDNFLV
jgi:predicted aldo/keto reductase-like oxidoreductase